MMSLESASGGAKDYKLENEMKSSSQGWDYMSCYEHNTPKSPTKLLTVELHHGKCRRQVLTRRKKMHGIKWCLWLCRIDFDPSLFLCQAWVQQCYWSLCCLYATLFSFRANSQPLLKSWTVSVICLHGLACIWKSKIQWWKYCLIIPPASCQMTLSSLPSWTGAFSNPVLEVQTR